ncbi:hypothetical protein [Cellulomonas rhizosphaerae]|uniref:Uncharacterized protein n=1 Tax=Cellulomonas rhizosphaerae TaxID=2293719 RepID=A0A413RNS4_9CELL|nr:hypothetical protein [Cellulomonas rhizosphaerae]RHA43669.1 hypothetical protein D1825_05140 [Cellulomonas rhizosphaerae]
MPCPPDARYAKWLVTRTENPPGQSILEPRRRAIAWGALYDGRHVSVPVWAVARARGWVCVEQKVDVHETWLAWLPAEDVQPV